MVEKYTEIARRTIFFARYEASQVGSPYIESEHLLLGLLREDKALVKRFFRSPHVLESIRKQIQEHTVIRSAGTAVDLPLSHESKRVLAYAAEESERLSANYIGTEHLLLGLLREEKCLAADVLHERGLRASVIREDLSRAANQDAPSDPQKMETLSRIGRDLTQAAVDGQIQPLLNRETEVRRVVETLCRRTNKNPVLIGDVGIVNTSIIEELAKRIAEGNVPSVLYDKRIVALDFFSLGLESSGPGQLKDRLRSLVSELRTATNVIIFFEELLALNTILSADGWLDIGSILTPPLLEGSIQCIAATTEVGYRIVIDKHNSLATCFAEVGILPLTEAEYRKTLLAVKNGYEKFHNVTIDEDAITAALDLAKSDHPDCSTLTKAMSLLDYASTSVRTRCDSPPAELLDVQKRIRFIVHRMESAIANHEFEKARFYSDEERKERDNLDLLTEKYPVMSGVASVTPHDVEEAARLWAGTGGG